MKQHKCIASCAGAALALTGAMVTSTPANAQPLVTGGLVNVVVTDVIDGDVVVLSDNNVALGVALGLAANVCDVNVNVLARQLRTGGATCDSDASDQSVEISQM
jgi:hypothetical protein